MIRNSIFLFFLMVCSCNYFKPEKKAQSIARVGKSYLYKSDIATLVPAGTTKEDSLLLVRDFIDRWASQKLLIEAAERNLSDAKKREYNTLIKQYKIDLYTKAYIEEVVKRTVDTVVSQEELKKYYEENDVLGGYDPYSNSKSCAELVVNSYNHSFFKEKNIFVATARAGNVIGGGDFSKDRILPDYFRSLFQNKKLILRSPNSIRPWQHVLEPLYGYLLLLMKLHKKQKLSNSSFNFGPNKSNNKSVNDVINLINKDFNNFVKVTKKNNSLKNYHESKILMLNSNKSKKILNWKTKYNLEQSVKLTTLWFKAFIENKNILKLTQDQIRNYFN